MRECGHKLVSGNINLIRSRNKNTVQTSVIKYKFNVRQISAKS